MQTLPKSPERSPIAPTKLRRRRGDRGEGVISTAIAVLVMAFLGAAMWVTFDRVFDETTSNTEDQVRIIGSGGAGDSGDLPGE